jgi:hypothetical protein
MFRSNMCKNLEYISLLQSRAMLAEPSKMHRNRLLAVHPATICKYKAIVECKQVTDKQLLNIKVSIKSI